MRLEDIESELKSRVEQTRGWLRDTESPVIEGLEARNTPCTAYAIDLIDEPKRKESDGIKFLLEFGRPDRRFSARAEVRIKPEGSKTSDGSGIANGPYVAVYVLGGGSDKSHLSFFDQFDNADVYFRGADDPIDEWYKRWLGRLLLSTSGATVFKHMAPITGS